MAFHVGQRILFQDRKDPIINYFHAASMGLNGVVMHLNAKYESGRVKPISGRVLRIEADRDGVVTITFRPDGWLLPEGEFPQGFQMESKYFQTYSEGEREFPGTITNPLGKAVSAEQIMEALLEKRRRREELGIQRAEGKA